MAVGDRVPEHRKRLCAAGLRPIQVWVPDVRAPGFADEARRQSLVVAMADSAADDQNFIETVSADWND